MLVSGPWPQSSPHLRRKAPSDPPRTQSDTAAVRLMGIRDGISAARTAVSARLATLEGLTDLPERHTSARALANPDSAMISSARHGLQEAQSNLDAAAEALHDAQAVARQQSATVTRLNGEVRLLVAAREDLERLAAIEKQVGSSPSRRPRSRPNLPHVTLSSGKSRQPSKRRGFAAANWPSSRKPGPAPRRVWTSAGNWPNLRTKRLQPRPPLTSLRAKQPRHRVVKPSWPPNAIGSQLFSLRRISG